MLLIQKGRLGTVTQCVLNVLVRVNHRVNVVVYVLAGAREKRALVTRSGTCCKLLLLLFLAAVVAAPAAKLFPTESVEKHAVFLDALAAPTALGGSSGGCHRVDRARG